MLGAEVGESDDASTMMVPEAEAEAEAEAEGVKAGKQGNGKSLRFSQVFDAANVEPHPKQNSNKVLPIDSEPDARSQGSNARSVSTTTTVLRQTIETGLNAEVRVLTVLRRLLLSLLIIVSGLTIAISVISKNVVADGANNADVATMDGNRAVLHQVRRACACV